MDSNNIYLDAMILYSDINSYLEMFLRKADPMGVDDLSELSSSEASAFSAKVLTELGFGGTYGYSCKTVTSQQQYKFVRLEYEDSGYYLIEYFTTVGGEGYLFTFQGEYEFIEWEYEQIEKVINSVVFDPPSKDSFYNYTESKVAFIVPKGWTEAPKKEEWEYIDAKFTLDKDNAISINYIFTDFYEELPGAQKTLWSRDELNNSFFSYADVADIFGCDTKDISMVSYGGKEYFMAETLSTATSLNLEIPMTQMLLLEEGNGYFYQFVGHRDSKYFDDFEFLVSNAKYPTTTDRNSITTQETTKTNNLLQNYTVLNLLVSLIITITVYSLPIIIYRYSIKKEPISNKKAKKITIIYGIGAFIIMSVIIAALNGSGAAGGSIILWSWINYKILIGGKNKATVRASDIIEKKSVNTVEEKDSVEENNDTYFESIALTEPTDDKSKTNIDKIYCYKCGEALPVDSHFCHKCGAKVYTSTDK